MRSVSLSVQIDSKCSQKCPFERSLQLEEKEAIDKELQREHAVPVV